MEQLEKKLREFLDTPPSEAVSQDDVAALTEHCPAFLLPEIMMLRHPHLSLSDTETATIIGRIALSLPDRHRLSALLDPEGTGRYDRFYPPVTRHVTPTTDNVIDTFLTNYGNVSPEEEALLNRMIFNPVPDYSATLAKDTPQPAAAVTQQDRMLDAFIAADKDFQATITAQIPDSVLPENIDTPVTTQNDTTPVPEQNTPPPYTSRPATQGSSLSESLARIFIKQHNYKRAYEIIESLSLNYPEKSVYFADQLRFLGKIIRYQESQKQNKTTI